MPGSERAAATKQIRDGSLPPHLSPPRLLTMIMLLIFIGEWTVMQILKYLPPLRWEILSFIDAAVLLVFLSPFYFILYLPLKTHHAERRRAEREVAFLTRHVIRAVEEEKKRFAHDMHDDCGPLLTALQFGIETLRCSLPANAPDLQRQCERLTGLTAGLAEHMRQLTARLIPLRLENGGIESALRWHLQEVGAGRPGLHLDLQVDGCSERYDPETEIALFRLCQEGLHNIVRHARATRATIRLQCGAEKIVLGIEDDGVGFLPRQGEDAMAAGGFGLIGMRERVAGLNGQLTIRSAPGSGTAIIAELPRKRRGDADPDRHRG